MSKAAACRKFAVIIIIIYYIYIAIYIYYSKALHDIGKRKSKKYIKKIGIYEDKNVKCIEKRNKQVNE